MTGRLEIIRPDWPAPAGVKAATTTRAGGFSHDDYASLNLGDHVDDDPSLVVRNREKVCAELNLPAEPVWLDQVHGNQVCDAGSARYKQVADAAFSSSSGAVCAVLTADCLPILLCDKKGTQIAAVHAGWRGLCGGVIENTLSSFFAAGIAPGSMLTWLGPAISQPAYEVDAPVKQAFDLLDKDFSIAFQMSKPGHWYFDLYAAARVILMACGVMDIYGGGLCTFNDDRFYSHRREGQCGRQASLIWRS